jgi:putative tryptophan/tyrosine transport system substrate-binding protein
MRRRAFIRASVGAALAWSFGVRAEQTERMHHIGLLGATSRAEYADFVEAMQNGLRGFGYVDGKNISIHYRWAEGKYDRLSELAAELVRLKVDIILTHGGPGTRAAKDATATIPIVGIVVGDLVSTGLVPSLARPGGNLTGHTFFYAEINAKRLELIKEAVPGAARVAVLVNSANEARHVALAAMDQTAQALRLALLPIGATTREGLAVAFATMAEKRVHALVVIDDALLISNADYIAELAQKTRIPMISGSYGTKREGFLIYGVDLRNLWFNSAVLVDRILRGAKPGDLPIQQATKFDLIINLRSAQALGLTVPPALLARADEVIE